MAAGELSTRMMIFPSRMDAAAVSRTLRKLEFREWIVPLVGIETFRQTFLIHGQGVHMDAVHPFLDLR